MAKEIVKAADSLITVKNFMTKDEVKERFNQVLGEKAPQFMASIVNCISRSPQLREAEPNSIMAAAFIAASLDLPIDSNLGFAAIVPYKRRFKDEKGKWVSESNAQFQIMYKGFIQLAIRSGEYEKMNCSEVYEDEIESYNPITGECSFTKDFKECKQRLNGETDKVVGYYAWYRLKTGFEKELYMTKEQVTNHAKRYSTAYQTDLNKGWSNSKWSTDFDEMGKKTVIKMLLSKWGILSIEMQKAISEDQKTYDSDGEGEYGDNLKENPIEVEAHDPFDCADEVKEEGVEENG